jgi:hypothetical protein
MTIARQRQYTHSNEHARVGAVFSVDHTTTTWLGHTTILATGVFYVVRPTSI